MHARLLSSLALSLALTACDSSKNTDDSGVVQGDDTAVTDADGDGYSATEDCDDADASVNPGADEVCDGVDNNCDGSVDEDSAADAQSWYPDADADGYGDATASATTACEAPSGYVADATDCDDTVATVNPAATEVCDPDDVDEDCDGLADDADDSVDGTTMSTWFADNDADGYGDPATSVTTCDAPADTVADDTDCDDTDAAINPGATEICDPDDVDEDCDGLADDADDSVDGTTMSTWFADNDADGYGDPATSVTTCDAPAYTVADDTDCDDTDAAINPAATEVCDVDDVDEDCDGTADDADSSVDSSTMSTWYTDNDGDGYGNPRAASSACDQPSGMVDEATDCDDGDAAVNPGATEVCDASDVDEDCNGVADDDDSGVDTSTMSSWYADSDADGYGDPDTMKQACDVLTGTVADDTDCDDSDASVNPGATEVCDPDDVDEDCNGLADDDDSGTDSSTMSLWYSDVDGDGYGDETDAGTSACDQPKETVSTATDCDDSDASVNPGETEVCDAGDVDEDCNGLADDDDSGVNTKTMTTWYPDVDLDGYGDDSSSSEACDDPSTASTDYLSSNGDCDDSDSDVNPGVIESCDGVDNDCDGTVDNDEDVLGEAEDCPAYSCLDIIDTLSTTPSDGDFWIDPDEDGTATEVYCDMTTDGGGYTFYKVNYGSTAYAVNAESYCDGLGMQLFVPRTEDHKDAALDIAQDSSIGGTASVYYMYILGIYPNSQGSTCSHTAFNSGSCTNWGPDDGGPYYVGTTTGVSEPNGDNGTTSSMYYSWSGYDISWYNDIVYPGYGSSYFMCQVGDKWGDGVTR